MGGKKRGSGGKICEHCFRARTGLLFLQMHDPTLISIRFPSGSGGGSEKMGSQWGKDGKVERDKGEAYWGGG